MTGAHHAVRAEVRQGSREAVMSKRRFWVGVASRDHVKAGVADGFCQLSHGKPGPMNRLSPGDGIVYYSPRTEMQGGEPVQGFTAIGIVAPRDPYTFDMGGGFVPTRRDITFLDAQDAPIKPLLDRLSFTKGRKSWGYALRRGAFEITEEDFAIIAAAMGANMQGPRDRFRAGKDRQFRYGDADSVTAG